jgi:hypothetical protein
MRTEAGQTDLPLGRTSAMVAGQGDGEPADMDDFDPTRRQFLEGAAAATAAGLLLPGCGPSGGESGSHPPINATPIPDLQLIAMPDDPYEDRRVVRVYDRRMTTYEFSEEETCALTVDADVTQEMLEAALVELARAETIAEAWAALLPGDLATARIAVKVNLNGDRPEFINTSPGMVIALARSLEAQGVPRESLTFFDRSRGYHSAYRDLIQAAVPGVITIGGNDVPVHETEVLQAPTQVLEDGSCVSVPMPLCVVEADHFINLHMLKGHSGGSTGSMKNLFGFARDVWATFHGQSGLGLTVYERGSQCADLVTQPMIREKSRLLISEGAFSSWWHANKPPDRFRNEDLFPDGLTCSLTVGRNPLHHDMVLFDLVAAERDFELPLPGGQGPASYPDDWLQNAAREPYEIGVFEHGRLVEGTFTAADLEYDYIDYRPLTTDPAFRG